MAAQIGTSFQVDPSGQSRPFTGTIENKVKESNPHAVLPMKVSPMPMNPLPAMP